MGGCRAYDKQSYYITLQQKLLVPQLVLQENVYRRSKELVTLYKKHEMKSRLREFQTALNRYRGLICLFN